MKRTRNVFTTAAALVLSIALLAGCGGQANNQPNNGSNTSDGPTMVLRLADNQPADYPTTIGDLDFAERVNKATNGRIKIEVYHSGQLGDEKSVIEQIQMGALDFARVNAQPLGEFSDKINVLNLPYLFDSEEHLWKVLNGEVGQEILDSLAGANMIGLTYYDSGSRNFYNTKRPVRTPADMAGLKIRVQQSDLMVDLVTALGASATPMAYGEVYNALKTNVIEGAENNWPSYYSTSHYEAAPYITLDHHTRTPEVLLASKVLWDKLSESDRQIILEAARASQDVQRKAWDEYEQKSIEAVKAAGNTIVEVTDFKPWQDAVAPLYEKYGAPYKDLIEKIKAAK